MSKAVTIVGVAVVVAAAGYVVYKQRGCGTDTQPPAEDVLSWNWKPGDPTWQPAPDDPCKPVNTAGSSSARSSFGAGDDDDDSGMSHNGFNLDCLDIAGNTWEEKWRNLAETSLGRFAKARSLSEGSLKDRICTDDDARTLMRYIVRCALGYDQNGEPETLAFHCTGTSAPTTITFEGRVGVAPAWRTQNLDDADPSGREKVTACIMAHANTGGQTVEIAPRSSFVAPHMQTATLASFPTQEGAFSGNLFPRSPNTEIGLYAFHAPGYQSSGNGRDCALPGQVSSAVTAPDVNRCGFVVKQTDQCKIATSSGAASQSFYDECHTGDTNPKIDNNPLTVYQK